MCYDDGIDVAELTRHVERCAEDLRLVKKTGLRSFRYPWRWPSIEREKGRYDWGFTDEAMAHLRSLEIVPIVDPCHHVSIPSYLRDGFLNPEFAERYRAFVLKGVERYSDVTHFTLFNEPYPTTLFTGKAALWYPYRCSPRAFVRIVANVAKAVCLLSRDLASHPGFQSIHFETCEHHTALDSQAREWAQFQNRMRFLPTDLMLGRVNRDHPLYSYLCGNGLEKSELRWFERNPARIDVLALDYYVHSEIEWRSAPHGVESVVPVCSPRGFASLALDYVERYRRPIMLGETNFRGTVTDRITWLKLTHAEAERLSRQDGVDFRAYGWFPLWDSCAWAHDLCRTAKTETDPVGIYSLDRARFARIPSELSDVFCALVAGRATSAGIPAYRLSPGAAEQMRGFMRFTRAWQWREPSRAA